jgi:hypothetical protein
VADIFGIGGTIIVAAAIRLQLQLRQIKKSKIVYERRKGDDITADKYRNNALLV